MQLFDARASKSCIGRRLSHQSLNFSTRISATSSTRVVSLWAATPSVIIVRQNGQPTATVFAPVPSASTRARCRRASSDPPPSTCGRRRAAAKGLLAVPRHLAQVDCRGVARARSALQDVAWRLVNPVHTGQVARIVIGYRSWCRRLSRELQSPGRQQFFQKLRMVNQFVAPAKLSVILEQGI